MTAPGVEGIRAELEAWNAGVKRARIEYRNHPLEKDVATVCLEPGCDNDRTYDKPRCALHCADLKTARNARYWARRNAS